jgi:hypothetical protein
MYYFLNKHLLTVEDIKTAANYGGQDIFLVIPLLSESLYYEHLVPGLCNHNESLYTKMFFSGQNSIRYTDKLESCDFSIVPFKFKKDDTRIKNICDAAKKYKKTVIAFFTDDDVESYVLPENLFLYRTSVNKNSQQVNERVMPALHSDHFFGFTDYSNSISFCGQLTELRYRVIQEIQQTDIKTDFIIRRGFWAPEVGSKIKARKQYYENLLKNRYALCVRGSGNFSFRFYEALCFGRIPILIDTDISLPFSHIIDWDKHIICIKESEISALPELIKTDNRDMFENRKLWEEYFSIEGYTKNFIKEINLS